MFNQYFWVGWALAKDRPQNERLLHGLSVGASRNPTLVAVAQKRHTDRITEVEQENAGNITRLQQQSDRLATLEKEAADNVKRLENSITVDPFKIEAADLNTQSAKDKLPAFRAGQITLAQMLQEAKEDGKEFVSAYVSKIIA